MVTETVPVPTIGIGAGRHCDGQVLVYHDLLGLRGPARRPKFVRRYAVARRPTPPRRSRGSPTTCARAGSRRATRRTTWPTTIADALGLYGGTTPEPELTQYAERATPRPRVAVVLAVCLGGGRRRRRRVLRVRRRRRRGGEPAGSRRRVGARRALERGAGAVRRPDRGELGGRRRLPAPRRRRRRRPSGARGCAASPTSAPTTGCCSCSTSDIDGRVHDGERARAARHRLVRRRRRRRSTGPRWQPCPEGSDPTARSYAADGAVPLRARDRWRVRRRRRAQRSRDRGVGTAGAPRSCHTAVGSVRLDRTVESEALGTASC